MGISLPADFFFKSTPNNNDELLLKSLICSISSVRHRFKFLSSLLRTVFSCLLWLSFYGTINIKRALTEASSLISESLSSKECGSVFDNITCVFYGFLYLLQFGCEYSVWLLGRYWSVSAIRFLKYIRCFVFTTMGLWSDALFGAKEASFLGSCFIDTLVLSTFLPGMPEKMVGLLNWLAFFSDWVMIL